MKTKSNFLQENQKIFRDVLKLIPPQTHKLSTFSGSVLSRDFKNLVSSYSPSVSNSLQIFREDFTLAPYRQPQYGEFLVHSNTFHSQEPVGIYLFLFKNKDDCSTVDTILSAITLYRAGGLGADEAAHTHRIASIWYESETDFHQTMPNLGAAITNCELHKFLVPVGPLVQNISSTFLNKLSTVVKGEVLTKASPPENVKVVFPADMYVDLDETHCNRPETEPKSPRVFYYACIVYVLKNNVPALSTLFFRSGKGFSDVMAQLKHFHADALIHKFRTLPEIFDINTLNFGAVCSLGYSSSHIAPSRGNLQFKSYCLPTVEVFDFVSYPGTWTVL
nr:capsid triplex subunit 1 [Macronycteris gammaherpesvirus 1]